MNSHDQLQDLFKHLEHATNGDRYMAYYGQLRALDYTHEAAIEETVVHFRLRDMNWYQTRMENRTSTSR